MSEESYLDYIKSLRPTGSLIPSISKEADRNASWLTCLQKTVSLSRIAHHMVEMLPHDILSLQTQFPARQTIFHFREAGRADSICQVDLGSAIRSDHFPHRGDMTDVSILNTLAAKYWADMVSSDLVSQIRMHCRHSVSARRDSAASIMESILKASEGVRKNCGRLANFVIMHPQLARLLADSIVPAQNLALGADLRKVGYLKNRWTVYLHDYSSSHISVGYRGQHHVDAGIVYAPRGSISTHDGSLRVDHSLSVVNGHYFATIYPE